MHDSRRRISNELTSVGELQLRPVERRDDVFLMGLFRASRPYLEQLPLAMEQVSSLIEQQYEFQIRSYCAQFPHAQHFLVLLHEQPIGRLFLHLNEGEGSLRVVDVCLATAYCGRGYGSKLFQCLQGLAEEDHWRLCLSVDRQNWRAKKWYSAIGFRVADSSATHDEMVWTSAIGMCCAG